MTATLSTRLLASIAAVGTTLLVAAAALAGGTAPARGQSGTPTLVALRNTSLGSILVDGRGRTLYLFERDHNGMSACDGMCASYWPPLTSHGVPRAGNGVKQSLLHVVRRQDSRMQVTYAGHPLYLFVGDRRAGQTAGEGLDNFGAEWYVVAATGRKVERKASTKSAPSSSNTGSGGYGAAGGVW